MITLTQEEVIRLRESLDTMYQFHRRTAVTSAMNTRAAEYISTFIIQLHALGID